MSADPAQCTYEISVIGTTIPLGETGNDSYAYYTMGGYGVRIQPRIGCSVGSKAMRLYGLRFGVHGGSGTLDRKV